MIIFAGLNYSPEHSGNAPYTSSLARYKSIDRPVLVLTGYPHYPSWKVADGYTGFGLREVVDGVMVRRFRHYVPRRPNGAKRFLMEISFGLRLLLAKWPKAEVEVFISPALFGSILGIFKAKVESHGAKRVLWVQDIYSLGLSETSGSAGFSVSLLRKFERWALLNVDEIVVIHDRFKNHMVKEMGISQDSITVIRNWSQFDFQPNENESATRSRYRWGNKRVILHAGNMGQKQGLDSVIAAAHLAAARGLDLMFILVGDGNQRRQLVEAAKNVQNLVFIDPVSNTELSNLMNAADLLLINEKPGVAEMSVPSKLTTYLQASKPILLASDEGGITDSEIRRIGCGLRVEAGNPAQLIDGIISMFANERALSAMVTKGAAFLKSHLSSSSAYLEFDSIFDSPKEV